MKRKKRNSFFFLIEKDDVLLYNNIREGKFMKIKHFFNEAQLLNANSFISTTDIAVNS